MATDFIVNGKAASTDAPPATPLLWVLREGLKLTGRLKTHGVSGWRRWRSGERRREGRYSGSQVAGIAEVSLDRGSGQIKVHDFWCTIDCGVAVQPDNVVAQTESSIVYGLGVTLSELITIKNGAVEQNNFYDYHVPRMKDVPQMHIEVIATENHPTGAGQMATPLVAPAISSAVAELTGVRLRHTPFTPERVKKALA